MRILLLGALALMIVFLGMQSYRLINNYRRAQRKYDEIIKKMAPLASENTALQANLTALQAGRGAERELHNAGYAAQGEKMLIIIPKISSNP